MFRIVVVLRTAIARLPPYPVAFISTSTIMAPIASPVPKSNSNFYLKMHLDLPARIPKIPKSIGV
jgi:hypothetical protein